MSREDRKVIDAPERELTTSAIDWEDVHRRVAKINERMDKNWEPSPGDVKGILKKRAEALAKVRVDKWRGVKRLFVVEFLLGDEKYGIEASLLQEVYPLKELTTLPGLPEFIPGIINVHGRIISVMDLKKFFSLPDKGLTNFNSVLIVRKGGMGTGILADDVLGMTGIDPDDIQPAMPTLTGIHSDYLRGVTSECLIVLEADRILDDPGIIVNEKHFRRG